MEMTGVFYDLRFSIRGLLRDRAFTLTAIAMLALAIGLNVTVFTIIQANLFRGIPGVIRNDRIVYIQTRRPAGAWGHQIRRLRRVAHAVAVVRRRGFQCGRRWHDPHGGTSDRHVDSEHHCQHVRHARRAPNHGPRLHASR
jgi:hypothetical protein